MIHVWPGMYVPPDDDAEQDEVTLLKTTVVLYYLQRNSYFPKIKCMHSCWET